MPLTDADLIGHPCEQSPLSADRGAEFRCGGVAPPARLGVHHGATIAPSDTSRKYPFRMARKTHRPATFGAWLESQLIRRDWNYSDLARRVGVRPAVVSRWIRNERTPNPASVDKIADALGRDPDEVLARAGHRPDLVRGELDDIHARLDPFLRQSLDRPDVQDAIVDIVRSLVTTAMGITPPDDSTGRQPEEPRRSGQAG